MLRIGPGTKFEDEGVAPGPCAVPAGFVGEAGSLVGVCGESGAGKSVFLRLLVDVLQGVGGPRSGVVKGARTVKYVPQDLGLLRECSLAANARFISNGQRDLEVATRYAPGELRQRFIERRNWSPSTLSGGERRMFVLSSALAADRELVILDEILVSMDRSLAASAIEAIRVWLSEASSRACIIVSHDPAVLSLCDKVYEAIRVELGSEVRPLSQAVAGRDTALAAATATSHAIAVPRVLGLERTQAVRLKWLGSLLAGSAVAVLGVLLLFHASRWFVPDAGRRFVPSLVEIGRALLRNGGALMAEGGWTLMTSAIAFILCILACAGYWLMIVNTRGPMRGIVNSIVVGMQAIPVLVLAPLVGVLFGVGSRIVLEILIGMFIAVFPLCLMGARQLVSVPEDMYRAGGARVGWGKLGVAVRTEWGAIIRGAVACAPLAAVGVVVGEYVVGRKGVGNLVFRAITSGAGLAERWGYAVGCVGVAVLVLMIAGGVGAAMLPKDVAPE
jgi:ABC-type lipoprotein export system ATPase subunit/ABC-type nitrate/sulfonate/bicarbonate transport system permease component